MQKTTTGASEGSSAPSEIYIVQSKDMDATASAPITSVENCEMHGSDVGVSATSGGMSTSIAGTPNATGTSTITIATSQVVW
jgi:hypothetical protein